MALLDEIMAKLDVLPPEVLIALEQKRRATAPVWLPNPGWQQVAIENQADEMFFGGEPGGGKSFLIVGAALTRHKNSIIFRREFPQIKGLEEAAEAILGSRNGYNASLHVWRVPGSDRVLEFGSVPHEQNKKRYQGRAHDLKCVAAGTPVLMADGQYRPIETICVGDLVATLSGPRRVTLLHQKRAAAVRVTATAKDGKTIQQVQGATHRLLTPEGWAAYCNEPTSLRDGPLRHGGDVYLVCPQQPIGAVGRSPRSWLPDDEADTPARTRQLQSYPHPYSSETRSADARVYVASMSVAPIGEVELFDLTVDEENHYITMGGFINQNCFDEITQFSKSQYKYLTLWLRSSDPKQRCRVIATGNPPDSPEGLWVIEYWGPWLDKNHPDPAAPGELRWPVPVEEGSEKELFFHTREEAMEHVAQFKKPPVDHEGKLLPPRSRTFVPGKLEENPEYVKSGYQSVLAYTSDDLKDLASGDFHAGLKDHPNQVIPSAWITDAQKRHTPRPPTGTPMTAIGVDVAQGGSDETVLAPRYDAWYAPVIAVPGKETPMPSDVAALVVKHRRDQAAVIVDCGGGYGGGVVERLSENSIATVAHKGSTKSHGRSKCRQYAFINKRAEVWWRFREALDPEQHGGSPIAIPDDAAVRADLAAPHFFVTPRGIQIEEKEETKKRIGRSPDKGDAIVMAWAEGQEALRRGISGPGAMPNVRGMAAQTRPAFANVGYRNAKRRH